MFVEKTIVLTRNRWNDVAKKSCLGGFLNLIFDMEFLGEWCLSPQPTTRGSMYFKFKQIDSLDLISAKSSSNTPQQKNTKKNRRKTRGKPPSFLGHKLVVFYLLLEGCCLYLKRSWVQFEIRNKFWAIPSAWPQFAYPVGPLLCSEAFELYEEMPKMQVNPNIIHLNALLNAYETLGHTTYNLLCLFVFNSSLSWNFWRGKVCVVFFLAL